MLDKNDAKKIEEIVGKSLSDFFHGILVPYLEDKFSENDKDHKEMKDALKRHETLLGENNTDHENMFRKLKQNQAEHDEMFVKLDKIEKNGKDQSKRIAKLEATASM